MQQFNRPNPLDKVRELRAMANGDPSALVSRLMQTNPSFSQFVQANRGKTPEQAFRDNGLDFSQYKNLI